MRIDCDLLTGYLGSGKTTLLNAWLRSPLSAGTAVVVNEVGEIGIDQLVLAQVTDNVMLLESGCLCCTLSGSLRETLLDVCATARAHGAPLRRIVVETTGLAEPLPILHSLLGDKILTEIIRLNQVVVTVDGQQGLRQLATQPESVRQLAAAECVVITKGDLAPEQDIRELRALIHQLNTTAVVRDAAGGSLAEEIFTASAGSLQREAVLTAIAGERTEHPSQHCDHHGEHRHGSEHDGAHHHGDDHEHSRCQDEATHHIDDAAAPLFHSRVSTLGFHIDHPIAWPGLAAWWHLVSSHYGDQLLRSKGLLRMQDTARPFVFMQTVGKVFHTPDVLQAWPDADQRSRVVCIGVDLERAWLAQSLSALLIDEPGLLPSSLAELSHFVPSHSE
ncbi:CobW family GTP-binding protein [Bordetella muralis]|uniref:CobW family GTP-binding protein n=1 Tax=Bordetella muralis TaxID=1649130 RepID=UPI0039EEA511